MMLKKFVNIFMALTLLLSISTVCAAAHITEDDCAIGGVKAGWHSQHHYLPDAFNDTALKDVSWQDAGGYRMYLLDKYPAGDMPKLCDRISRDHSLTLLGVYKKQDTQAKNSLQALFKKQWWLYIYAIRVDFNPNINTSYKVLATDMQTPRGIKVGDTLDDVYRAYGREDEISDEDGIECYWYVTEKSWRARQSNPYYVGARLGFLIYDNTVMSIIAINTYGSQK